MNRYTLTLIMSGILIGFGLSNLLPIGNDTNEKTRLRELQSDVPHHDYAFDDRQFGTLDCGGLSARKWKQYEGWEDASCREILQVIANTNYFADVSVTASPNVPEMLAYSQYGRYFRIKPEDFEKAKGICQRLLASGLASENILSQCEQTVSGIVPYGLKLRE